VLDNGRFIVLRYPLLELYDINATLLMSKKLQVTTRTLSIVLANSITVDSAGFLYIYVYGYSINIFSLQFDYASVLAKLDSNANLITTASLNYVPFTSVRFNAEDGNIYLKNQLQIKVFDTDLTHLKTKTFYSMPQSDFFSSGNLMLSFDGVNMMKLDLNSSQLCVTKLRQSENFFMPGMSVMVNKCLMVSIFSDYANAFFPLDSFFKKASNTFLSFLSVEKEKIFELDAFKGFQLSSPISLVKVTRDLKLYVFDTKINRLFVFDFF